MENITPKEKKLLEYVKSTGGLHDHLRSVAEFCLAIGTESEGLTAKMCNDLYFIIELSGHINIDEREQRNPAINN